MNREEWHNWRKAGLGASDAPIVMGVSPWKTRLKLWQEKTSQAVIESDNTWATERGNALEPMARADYELRYGLDMPVVLAVHEDYSYLRASLDGYNAETKTVLEIKCPGADDHESAKAGIVPKKYYPQLQHQLLVTGADRVHYYSFDGIKGEMVEVLPNHDYISVLLDELIAFWHLVETKTPPEKMRDDFKPLRFKGATQLMRDYFAKKVLLDDVIAKLPDTFNDYRIGDHCFSAGKPLF